MAKITIMGSGTWGTAIANMLANTGHEVTLYSRFEKECNLLKSELKHPNLPGCVLSDKIVFTTEKENAIKSAEMVVIACPSPYVRETVQGIKDLLNINQIIITVAKGIEDTTLFTMSEVIHDVLGQEYKVVALSGPTHAEEVSIGLPTLIVSSCEDEEVAKLVQHVFYNDTLRVYTNTDIKGVELCGALKNIIALAAGMSDGLGYGDNAKAAIVTRGLNEITRLGKAMGCNSKTFYGLTGIGDIVVTAASKHSRNHNFGYLIGQGYSAEESFAKVGMVVEGVNALKAAKKLEAKYKVELPIIDIVYEVLVNGKDVKTAIVSLFSRAKKSEI
ncbi:MAG: NAD(P)-dependent glycerol-3-phosphate dehydrogenase [Bacilli bacterium]|nr:NAD(P)-dependent glycerol-3-phosphate dehydrogenase [Bacilli bacterium]